MLIKQVLAAVLFFSTTVTFAQTTIGEWRDHFPYNNALAVAEGGGKVYAATEFGIFTYVFSDNSIERLTKINALSDAGIISMEWNNDLGALVVGYENGNVDIIYANGTTNVADIERSGILGDKGIYNIRMDGDLAFLSCGFGVVVLDVLREEIKETYMIGPGGSQVKVNDVAFYNDSIYAATEDGLFWARKNDPNLSNFNNWSRRMDIPTANGPFNLVESFQGNLFVNYRHDAEDQADTLYRLNGGWSVFSEVLGRSTVDMNTRTGNKITITHKSNIHVFNESLNQIEFFFEYQGSGASPSQCLHSDNGNYWISDTRLGLVSVGNGEQIIVPNGPPGSEVRRMSMVDGNLWVATGSVAGNWGNEFQKKGVYKFINGVWGHIDRNNESEWNPGWNEYGGGVNDFVAVTINPNDPSVVFVGSWDEGVLEFRNGEFFQFHTSENSTLQPQLDFIDEGKVNVAGIVFDEEGNMWMTNANVEEPISVRTVNGSWRSFNPGSVLQNNTLMADIIITMSGLKWIVRPRNSGILVFNDNNTIFSTTDDEYKILDSFEGSGGLPSTDVFAIAEDLDGEVWVGTGEGVAVFFNPDAVFTSNNFDAQQILIEQDGNIQILLETEVVTAIAIDGANRKWFGTQGAGVFLMSEEGTREIHHFTKENSPLLSDAINDIVIDQTTGEVFFGTEKGIMSYKSDATGGELLEATCANVYPNPVRETYSGPIAITGLARDSDVKITDISGNLVFRTSSEGGQALWNGNNMDGKRVSTGVYLAFSADREGELTCVTKILFIK